MANRRSKPKAKAAASRADAMAVSIGSENTDLRETALRKLPRSELQKLAMANKVKANMKSEQIIRQLSSLQIPKRPRPAGDEPNEAPSQKRFKKDTAPENNANSLQSQVALPIDVESSQGAGRSRAEDPQLQTVGSSAPQSAVGQNEPAKHLYDANLFSGTESEMTEEEQLDYATPVSSRAETPPPANVNDLKRCVTIMQEISVQDTAMLEEVMRVREIAAKLRKKARSLRDLMKAERGRRERMEGFYRYWQVIGPDWDREWLYGSEAPEQDSSEKVAEPPSGQEGQQQSTAVPERKPALSPEELKQRRQAIIAKQEAEQRQLAALRRAEMRHKDSLQGQSSDASSDSERNSGADQPLTEEDVVDELLMVPDESGER